MMMKDTNWCKSKVCAEMWCWIHNAWCVAHRTSYRWTQFGGGSSPQNVMWARRIVYMRTFRLYWAPVSLQFCLILIEILQFFTKVLGTLYLLFRSFFTTCTKVHGTGATCSSFLSFFSSSLPLLFRWDRGSSPRRIEKEKKEKGKRTDENPSSAFFDSFPL